VDSPSKVVTRQGEVASSRTFKGHSLIVDTCTRRTVSWSMAPNLLMSRSLSLLIGHSVSPSPYPSKGTVSLRLRDLEDLQLEVDV
jgi:hypothetical protein